MIQTADRLNSNAGFTPAKITRRNIFYSALLLCFVLFPSVQGQSVELKRARAEYDNGSYAKAIEFAVIGIEKASKIRNSSLVGEGYDICASAQISLGEYAEAENSLNAGFQHLPANESEASLQKAMLHIRFAWLRRQQRKFTEALEHSKKAIATAPNNRRIEAEHYLNIGRILFASGYDISAVVWLEKAEKLLEADKDNPTRLDVYRFLTLACSSKLNYQTALRYAEKWSSSAEKSRFKYKYRYSLFESATLFSGSGQKQKAFSALEKGLKLSEEEGGDAYQIGTFLHSLLLHVLYEADTTKAADYLSRLEKVDTSGNFSFEIKLAKAILAAYQGQREISEGLFAELSKAENTSKFILPYWKITIAENNQEWERLLKHNQELLELIENSSFREDLPGIYLNFAKAYYRLNQNQKASDYLEKSLSYIEEIRNSDNPNLSLGLSETYHDAYRLLVQLNLDKSQESFETADFLKARLLKDRISNAAAKAQIGIAPAIRKTLEELSLKYIDDRNLAPEIERYEKIVTQTTPKLNLIKPDLTELSNISDLDDAAIISYFYSLDKKLVAFVREKNQPLKTIYLPVSETEVDNLAQATERKIKTFIFFKRDGKEIYDKLLKPLNVAAKHLIIIPDKSLWKIPFQALSADGEKYLIEDKLISYAPSVSILLEQLKKPRLNRQTLQAYANSSYEDRVLQFVNAEASSVARIYDSKPILGATIPDFARTADKTDILHFSMHAQIDKEQPLNSFLGFRKLGADDGRLTTEELLKVKLKKGSLAFLASCDTNNVLSGEGLVSLAWAMMGSGATTVVSAQWEADDKSTQTFTKAFYVNYKKGDSSSKALQKASLELIKNKSNEMHAPYYWANFTLTGDFR